MNVDNDEAVSINSKLRLQHPKELHAIEETMREGNADEEEEDKREEQGKKSKKLFKMYNNDSQIRTKRNVHQHESVLSEESDDDGGFRRMRTAPEGLTLMNQIPIQQKHVKKPSTHLTQGSNINQEYIPGVSHGKISV